MPKHEQPQSLREQLEGHNAFVRTLVSIAVITGYGAGTVKAHIRPKLRRIGAKFAGPTPGSITILSHGYRQGVLLGLEEENFRRAERAAARAAFRAIKASNASRQGRNDYA